MSVFQEFQVQGDKVCYTPLKDKCDAIRNPESPKTLRQIRAFCGMDGWMDETKKAFNEIKNLLISPPVLKVPTPDGLFRLKSDTSREGVSGTLLQMQGDEWVVIGYHSKRLPKPAKNSGVTEL